VILVINVSSVPDLLNLFTFPALKRWANIACPSGAAFDLASGPLAHTSWSTGAKPDV